MAHARPAPRLFPLLAALLGIALLPEGAPGLIDAPPGHQLCGHVGGGYAYPDRGVSLQPSGWSTRTDESGRFCFTNVPDGSYRVGLAEYCINGSACFPHQTVAIDGADVEVALLPELCDSSILHVSAAFAAPGTEVDVVGFCQCLHSGGHAPVLFDGVAVDQVRGDTPGCYRARVTIPLSTTAGSHRFAVPLSASREVTASVQVPAAPNCAGDCDGNASVTIDELLRGIGVALGSLPLAECTAVDAGGDGSATIDDVMTAVSRALRGCPAELRPASLEAVYDVTASSGGGDEHGMAILRDAGAGEVSIAMLFSEYDSIHVQGRLRRDGTMDLTGASIAGGDVLSPVTGSAAADLTAPAQRISGTLEIDDFFDGPRTVDLFMTRPAVDSSPSYASFRLTVDHSPFNAQPFRSALSLSISRARRGLATCGGSEHVTNVVEVLPNLTPGPCALSPEGRFDFVTTYAADPSADGPQIELFGTLSAGSGAPDGGSFHIGAPPELLDSGVWTAAPLGP